MLPKFLLLAASVGLLTVVHTQTISYGDKYKATVTIVDDEVQQEFEDITLIANNVQNTLVIKPKGEDKCMYIRGVKGLPTTETITRMMKSETTPLPEKPKMIQVKQAALSLESARQSYSKMTTTLCKSIVKVDVAYTGDPAQVTQKVALSSVMSWWPWTHWWPRPCAWCYHGFPWWPCFTWPWWFFHYPYVYWITW